MWAQDPIGKMGDAVGIEFLPLGKGALILILGGLVALVVSLMWSLAMPRATPTAYARSVPRSPEGQRPLGALIAPQTAVVTPASEVAGRLHRTPAIRDGWSTTPIGARWQVDVAELALRMGLGRPAIDVAGPARYTVRLPSCRSCQGRGGRSEGCQVERRALERVVRETVPGAAVVETRCRGLGQGPCLFEVLTGALT